MSEVRQPIHHLRHRISLAWTRCCQHPCGGARVVGSDTDPECPLGYLERGEASAHSHNPLVRRVLLGLGTAIVAAAAGVVAVSIADDGGVDAGAQLVPQSSSIELAVA